MKKIKESKIHVSFLTILLLAVLLCCRSVWPMLVAYGIALLHEGAHVLAASFFDISFSKINIMPFGIQATLKKSYIEDPQKEFWICFAGPLANVLMFVAGLFIQTDFGLDNSPYMHFFLSTNMLMFLLNMLPILPLDGGRMLKSCLIDRYGAIKSFNFVNKVGKIALVFFVIIMLYVLYTERFSISFIILFAFLVYSVFSEKAKNNLFLMKEIACSLDKMDYKKILRIQNIAVSPNYKAAKLIEKFSYNTFTIIDIIDDAHGKRYSLTEIQLIKGLIELGTDVKVMDIFQFYY